MWYVHLLFQLHGLPFDHQLRFQSSMVSLFLPHINLVVGDPPPRSSRPRWPKLNSNRIFSSQHQTDAPTFCSPLLEAIPLACSKIPRWSFAIIMPFISLEIQRSLFLSFHSTACIKLTNSAIAGTMAQSWLPAMFVGILRAFPTGGSDLSYPNLP